MTGVNQVVRHIALVKWKAQATPDQIRTAQEAFAGFVPHMPGYVRHQVAADLKIDRDPAVNWDFGYIADFKSIEDFKAYQKDPMHTEYGVKFVHAAREDSRRVQILCDGERHLGRGRIVRHAALYRWKPEARSEVAAAASAMQDRLASTSGLIGITHGPNLGIDLRPELNPDYAVILDFTDAAAFKDYQRNNWAESLLNPLARSLQRVQCEWGL